jgi:uroporphyrinogen-III synthase
MLEKGAIDMVTFTSSSTVNNFVEMFKTDVRKLQKWMDSVAVACIGPITAKTAQENGFTVTLTPPEYTIESLTDSIVQYFSSH